METGKHILRTSLYVVTLARQLQKIPRFSALLSDRMVNVLGKSAPLHDIGKVGIPDHILQKPGRLTPDEWKTMRTHAELGAQAIERAEQDAEHQVEFLAVAKTIAHWHHENWDGSGYPDGLAGDQVPLAAQLMKIADVFDALVSRRVYKNAMTPTEVLDVMSRGRGTQFDPELYDVFSANFDAFVTIAEQHKDHHPTQDSSGDTAMPT